MFRDSRRKKGQPAMVMPVLGNVPAGAVLALRMLDFSRDQWHNI
jgi:hypothetical protein